VVLGAPVHRIEQTRSGVQVHCDRGTISARRVIVAVPPALAAAMHFVPGLPHDRAQLQHRWAPGNLTKVAVVYDEPFWRARGLTGSALTTAGPISFTYDDTPPHGRPGIMVGFIGGDNARAYARMSAATRRHAVLGQLAAFFPYSAVRRPRQIIETSWATEEWTRGCPVGIPAVGSLVSLGPALRAPVGRIHWAGTETATYWNGYMDGAVSAGERAAGEVRSAL
jgi:monoamine oxidase